MVRPVESEEHTHHTSVPEGDVASRIQETLEEILASTPFRSSRQSQELLRYIVDNSLAGHTEALKERLIGVEVFGRSPDYDTNNDPIVRARVSEVRKRLALYYQAGHSKTVRITVPHGSFKAVFERTEESLDQSSQTHLHAADINRPSAETLSSPVAEETARREIRPSLVRFRGRALWVAVIATAVIVAAGIQINLPSSESRAFNRFWSPILESKRTTLIYVGGNAVYQLSPEYMDSYYRQHSPSRTEEMGFESYIQWPPGTKIDAQDLFPAKDTFVTIGDVAAITKIESLLVRRDRQFDIRYGEDVAYGDLRQSPTILIGAHNNAWTLTITGDLHFVFSGRDAIVDRSAPQKRWSAPASFTEDYAIVSRVLNSKAGTTVISVAGIGYAGTQAAADFLTNPQSISALVQTLPKDWEKKNIQIVLHTTVTNQLPSAPDVVATYTW